MKNYSSSILPPSHSQLLSLPAELRNRIYEYALIEENEIAITADLHVPALLQTSRQIRREARSLYFEKNTFTAVRVPIARLLLATTLTLLSYLRRFET